MRFRMSRELKELVEAECEEQDLTQADDKEVAAILQEFEQSGHAMRALNRRGQVVWKPTPNMLGLLASAEAEADAEEDYL